MFSAASSLVARAMKYSAELLAGLVASILSFNTPA